MSAETYDDAGALTLVPATGGEAWVEPTGDDEFQIGVEDAKDRGYVPDTAFASVTREELVAFRDLINQVLDADPVEVAE